MLVDNIGLERFTGDGLEVILFIYEDVAIKKKRQFSFLKY